MTYTHILWDWNGTLLDDVRQCIIVMNGILSERGLKTIASDEEYRGLFCFPVSSYYGKLGFDFSSEPFEELARIYIDRYTGCLPSFKLFDGAVDTLRALKHMGLTQVILSASEIKSLLSLVDHFGISDYFNAVLGLCDHYASSKVELAESYFKQMGIDMAKTLIIGDTIHDFEVAKAIGCGSLLIANGHQDLVSLKKTGSDVIFGIRDVISYIGV
jgi:phosphoglycolate phosphatase